MGTGQAMTTRQDLMAKPTTENAIRGIEWEIWFQDPDVAALIAEVDAIECAALKGHRRPPAPPPATGLGLLRSRPVGRSCGARIRRWRVPAHHVRAVQRSPRTGMARHHNETDQ
jgi:hypothetical protein